MIGKIPMKNTHEKPSFYAVIPADVRYADITPNAKLLYGEITALCSKEGYCWAGNSYFANLYQVDNRTVSRWINELVALKVVFVTGSTSKRHLQLVTKLSIAQDKNVARSRDKIVQHSITPEITTGSENTMFEEFWKSYPRKISKKMAEKSFNKIKPNQTVFEVIMAGLEKYKGTSQWQKDGGMFIPHPTTWLNQERWKDEIEPARVSQTKSKYAGL